MKTSNMETAGKTQLLRGIGRASLCLPAVAALLAGIAGCSRLEPAPPLTRRVAVLDFQVAPAVASNPYSIRGWWFGARTIYREPRHGGAFADVLSKALTELKYIEQQSRPDVRYYMGRKRKMLEDKFKDIDSAEAEQMLARVSPVEYGAELGVDQVLTGEILESYLSDQRTIHTWHSYVKVRVDLWDMATGKVVWTRTYADRRSFASSYTIMERLAEKAVHDLDKGYYRKQNKPL